MRQEIKQRIERINLGEVPEGYKKTKVGIIPKDWIITMLGNKINIFRGASPRPKGDPKYFGGTIPRLLIEDVTRDGKYAYPCIDFLTEEGAKKSRLLKKGAIVMSCSGTKVGIVGFLGIDACIHDGFFGFNDFKGIELNFLYFLFIHLADLWQSSATTGGVFNNLTTDIMKNLIITLPPLPEQKKIAEILLTWDKAIELKEQYIKNLEDRKKGLMQKLLTGKVRLSGFNGKWQKVLSKYIFENISDKKHDSKLDVLSVTQENGVVKRTDVGIDIKYDKESLNTYKKVIPGQFIISLRSFQGGIEFSEYEGLVSPAYTILSNSKPICEYYYKYYFKTKTFISKLNSLIYGIRDGKQIGYSDFSTLKIDYPPIEEQTAIANILSLADLEISLQKAELETLKLQKKGLMQVLLTGKVRVTK